MEYVAVWITLGFTALAFFGALLRLAYHFGHKEQALNSEIAILKEQNRTQAEKNTELLEAITTLQTRNESEHKDFYQHRQAAIRLEESVFYIKSSIDEIKSFIRELKK